MKLNKMSIKDLQQLLRNCNNQIETPEAARLAREVVAELQARNAFKPGQWKGRWNAAEVAEALEPFRVIAAAAHSDDCDHSFQWIATTCSDRSRPV